MAVMAMCLLLSCAEKKEEATLSGLLKSDFVSEVEGKPTALYVLKNKNGAEACITNYGGRLVSVMVPDKKGNMTDVVLGYDNVGKFVASDGNYGALIGRYGNRINQAKFTLDDTEYTLPANDGNHCLHGGPLGYHTRMWDAKQFTDQYHVVLPEVVKEHAPGTDYRPSSPFSTFGNKSNDHDGDRHYWEVWHGKVPITNYNLERSRFFSEYGFQSFPEFQSVKQYAPNPEDWNITSEVMMSHQRGGMHANQLIETYLLNEYRTPKNFEAFLYMNHVLQGDAIKTAIEAHRRDMPYCMGTLFWQHNDCWPVASWASRDWYGRWKAQHYFARPAFDDILVSPLAEGNTLNVRLVSDRRKTVRGKLRITVMDMDGALLSENTRSLTVAPNASRNVYSADISGLLHGCARNRAIVVAEFTTDGRRYANIGYFVSQKELELPEADIRWSVGPAADGYEITLSSDRFVRAVWLALDGDEHFEDNYFDLVPGVSKTVRVATTLSRSEFDRLLRITHLQQTR